MHEVFHSPPGHAKPLVYIDNRSSLSAKSMQKNEKLMNIFKPIYI